MAARSNSAAADRATPAVAVTARSHSAAADPATLAVDLSVIVPFRNSAPHLRDQLAALARQEFSGAWEVIAVDNGSDDASREIAESFAGRLNLRIVDARGKAGAGYARNVGAHHATGGKLLFVDADDEVAPGYVAAMADGLDRFDFVTSAFDHRPLNPEWLQTAHGPVWRDPDDPTPSQWGVLPTAGGSVGTSRAVFEKVGGFPEDLPRMEDIAFSWEVQFAGTPLHYVPEAVYRVRYRDSLRDLFRQGLAGGSTGPLLYRRYRSAGVERRTAAQMTKSWVKLAFRLAGARRKADLAPLVLQLGRQLGRVRGSIRHRVFFP
jgi:glycosyltransferase involved in cell wall biosynthesis